MTKSLPMIDNSTEEIIRKIKSMVEEYIIPGDRRRYTRYDRYRHDCIIEALVRDWCVKSFNFDHRGGFYGDRKELQSKKDAYLIALVLRVSEAMGKRA